MTVINYGVSYSDLSIVIRNLKSFCNTKRTKYKCVLCDAVACNVFANKIQEDYVGYDGENKKGGVCQSS